MTCGPEGPLYNCSICGTTACCVHCPRTCEQTLVQAPRHRTLREAHALLRHLRHSHKRVDAE